MVTGCDCRHVIIDCAVSVAKSNVIQCLCTNMQSVTSAVLLWRVTVAECCPPVCVWLMA